MDYGLGDLSDRELLVRLYERVDNMGRDVTELKNRPCPQPLCKEHQDAITKIEAKLKYTYEVLVVVIPAIITVMAIILDKVF